MTSQTSFGIRGCLISNRLPTAMPGPSRATRLVTEAVHSGQRSTSLKTSQTTVAGASMSTPQSVIMYQTVHELGLFAEAFNAPQTTESACGNRWTAIPSSKQLKLPSADSRKVLSLATKSLATTPTGYGRFIGRVGALAVALGIGVAIANSPGLAWAQDGPSGASDSSPATRVATGSPASAGSGSAEGTDTSGEDANTGDDDASNDDGRRVGRRGSP